MLHGLAAGRVGFNREMGALDSVEQGQGEDVSGMLLRTTEEAPHIAFPAH